MGRFTASLRFRLILLVFLAVLPALGLILYSGLEYRRLAAVEAQKDALDLARHVSLYQELVIEGARQLLVSLAELPAVRQHDGPACSAFFAKILAKHPEYANISAADGDGKVFGSALPHGPLSAADRPFFQRALQTRDFVIGEFGIGRASGKATVHVAYPVLETAGQVQGVVYAGLDLAYLNSLATKTQLPAGSVLNVIDRQGTVLVHHPDPGPWVGKALPDAGIIKTVLEQREGVAETRGLDGAARLYAFTPLGGATPGLFVVVGTPGGIVYGEANRILTRNLAALGVAAALALSAAFLFSQLLIIGRTRVLVNTAQQLAAGDLGARSGLAYAAGEFGQLAQAIDGMAAALEQRGQVLKESEAKYRSLVEGIPAITYIIALDEARTLLYVSPQTEAILGIPPSQFTVDPEFWKQRLHPDDRARVMAEVNRGQATGETMMAEFRMQAKSGAFVWFRAQAAMVRDRNDQPLFIQGIMLDITERKRAEENVQASEELYRSLLETTGTGYVIIDDQGKVLDANAEYVRLTGHKALKEIFGRSVGDWTAAHDRERNEAAVQECARQGYMRNLEIDYADLQGRITPVEINATVLKTEGGAKIITLVRDISKRRRDQKAMESANEQLRLLVAESGERNRNATLLNDLGETLQVCQSSGEAYQAVGHFVPRFFPDEAGALYVFNFEHNLLEAVAAWGEGPPFESAFPPDDCWAMRRGRIHLMADLQAGMCCRHVSGTDAAGYLCAPMMAQGEALGILHLRMSVRDEGRRKAKTATGLEAPKTQLAVTLADSIALALANLRLRETLRGQAIRDSLTGLFNRRYLEETLKREVERARRLGGSLGVIMLDLDHFKQFNDTQGHGAGDALLSALGDLLQTETRPEDIVCRYGGEEFLVVLPGTSLEVSQERAENLRQAVKRLRIHYMDQVLSATTISLGVAGFPEHGGDADMVIRVADQALYRAKQEGRDRVVVAARVSDFQSAAIRQLQKA